MILIALMLAFVLGILILWFAVFQPSEYRIDITIPTNSANLMERVENKKSGYRRRFKVKLTYYHEFEGSSPTLGQSINMLSRVPLLM